MIINNHLPGSKYKESGKVAILPFLGFLVLGYLISSLVGIGYGLLSDLNPIIYLNFILLLIAACGVILSAYLFKIVGKLRNRYMAILLAVFYGFVCIYNAWSAIYTPPGQSVFGGMIFQYPVPDLIQLISFRDLSISRLGRGGTGLGTTITSLIYVIEFLVIILLPAIFTGKNPTYYCEECGKSMNETADAFYYGLNQEQSPNLVSDVKSGKLKDMLELVTYPEKKLSMNLSYIRSTIHECPECKKLVYSADLGDAKLEKGKTTFHKLESLASNLYGSRNS